MAQEESPRKVVVVGSLTMDFTAVAGRMPELGETVLGDDFLMVAGGKGNNQAIAAARAGGEVTMIGCVGDDDLGPMIRSAVVEERMDDGVMVVPGKSGVAHIMVGGGGTNRIIMIPLANALLSAEKVRQAAASFQGAGVVLCQLEVPVEAVVEAFRIGRQESSITILNPAPAAELSDELCGLVDILIPNETEASWLTGCDTSDLGGCEGAARQLLARGIGTVIITRGAEGILVATADGARSFAPFSVQAIDSTAAGDAFCGALASGLASGAVFDDALLRAQAAGALATTVLGASPSLPQRDLIDALVARGSSR